MNAHSRVANRALAVATALAILATYCPRLQAQTAPVAPPSMGPRIGLALSGGGARGIAHVGVLKVLDELRVPISCVTGTSMGAIVGGDVRGGPDAGGDGEARPRGQLGRDLPGQAAARGNRGPAQDRRLQDAVRARVRRQGRRAGAAQGRARRRSSIESFFRVAGDAGHRHHRLSASCRFRSDAMATDIETGQDSRARPAAAWRRRCARACRCPARCRRSRSTAGCWSTAASPTTCRSTRRASSARDVIIAVNISTPPLTRDEITSALSVVEPAHQLPRQADGRRPAEEPRPTSDVLIAPDLGDISAVKFDRSKDAIRIGEEATRALADKLTRYSLPPEQYAALRGTPGRRGEGRSAPSTRSASRDWRGTNPAVVRELVESKPGEPLSEEKIGADLRRIFGTRRLREHRLPDRRRGRRPARDGHRRRRRSRGGPTTCASASASPATSRATTSSTRSSSTGRPGSTGWAANGRPRRRSARTRTCSPSSTSRSTRRATGSSRPTP